jgi:hypothetical protein
MMISSCCSRDETLCRSFGSGRHGVPRADGGLNGGAVVERYISEGGNASMSDPRSIVPVQAADKIVRPAFRTILQSTAVLTASLSGPASAADLARPRAHAVYGPAVAFYNWTGCCVGGNGGGFWARRDWSNPVFWGGGFGDETASGGLGRRSGRYAPPSYAGRGTSHRFVMTTSRYSLGTTKPMSPSTPSMPRRSSLSSRQQTPAPGYRSVRTRPMCHPTPSR